MRMNSSGSSSPSAPTVWTDLNGVYTLPLSVGAWQAGQNASLGGLSTPTFLVGTLM